MFKFIKNNKRIKTKNLYQGELKKFYIENTPDVVNYCAKSFNPRRYVLVRIKDSNREIYTDIFTKSKYKLFSKLNHEGEVVIYNLVPLLNTKKYIKYKDAEEIFKSINQEVFNGAYIKK